jgi:gas vesicle protein
MKKSTLLIFAAVGTAAALLLLTDRGKKMTKDLADNAGEWKDSWTKFAGKTGNKLTSLLDTLSHELNGLTSEARQKVLAVLSDKAHNGQHIKN